jgi:hypothetical protein
MNKRIVIPSAVEGPVIFTSALRENLFVRYPDE